ncbi:MAG: FixH family protein [Draconibacterium sp.]|nr:FixH family protein [Draconibacterium sp.]
MEINNYKKAFMKFNWGTGILIFLILFLAACAAFIIFAMRQEVNLVHKDYYEKGVDYTDKMNVDARSTQFGDKIQIDYENEYLLINFEESLVASIDSGKVLLYRPSSSKQDALFLMTFSENVIKIPKENLVSGRYILKLSWYSEGLKYDIDKPVDIQ